MLTGPYFSVADEQRPPCCFFGYPRPIRRMSLSAALGTTAHGHIHEIVGGAWSMEAGVVAKRTTDLVLPFLHVVQASLHFTPAAVQYILLKNSSASCAGR